MGDCFCLFGLDTSENVVKSGHIFKEWVWVGLVYVEESNSRQIALDGLVLEVLPSEIRNELA